MADDELEKLLSGEEDVAPPAEEKPKADPQEPTKEDLELEAKRKQLDDLDKAKQQALADLSAIRKAKKLAKEGKPEEDEEIPKIDFEDPSAKAWQKHIRAEVQPAITESEREKAEVLDLALQKFLSDKPALAKNSDKLKELMENYQSLSDGKITGKNSEVVMSYLNKAYAAADYQSLIEQRLARRRQQAEDDIQFSEPGVSAGTGAYASGEDEKVPFKLTQEQRDILRGWNMTPQQYYDQYIKPKAKA